MNQFHESKVYDKVNTRISLKKSNRDFIAFFKLDSLTNSSTISNIFGFKGSKNSEYNIKQPINKCHPYEINCPTHESTFSGCIL